MTGARYRHVVIVGAGHGGGALAALLRNEGHAGPITLIGAETVPLYQRPPLSKGWLLGETDQDSLALRPVEFYADSEIDLRLGCTVAGIDLSTRTLHLIRGETINFDHLVLATGARARGIGLPGSDLPGVMSLRDWEDATRLRSCLVSGQRLAIVGGGYVGLEVAASARKLGVQTVVIEREPRLLARVACRPLSDFFERLHRAHGVDFHFNADLAAIEDVDGVVCGLRMSEGALLPCDNVLIGVGAIPNDELARSAGLVCDNGVVVDEEGRTSAPGVYAIGDVTRRPMPLYGRMARLESVPNVIEQGRQVCASILGLPVPKPEVPWFWSDQYDIKLQIAGVAFEAEQVITRGDPFAGRFAVFHLLGGRVMAVEAVGAVPEFVFGKQLIMSRRVVDPAILSDTNVPMKQVLAA